MSFFTKPLRMVAVLAVALFACTFSNANPIAGFTYAVNGLEVSFIDTSNTSGPTTRHWGFGTGDSSFVFNPVFLYQAPGTYNVCLAVWDSTGVDTFCVPVTVTCNALPAIMGDTGAATRCLGTTDSLVVNANGQLLSFQWQVNMGSGFTNLAASTVYSGAASNALVLSNIPQTLSGNIYRCVLTNPCGDTGYSAERTLTVANAPMVTASASPILICAGDTVQLQASGADAWLWQPSAVVLNAMQASSAAVPVSTTNFLVLGTDTVTGCTGSATVLVEMDAAPSLTLFTGLSTLCEGAQSYILASSTGTISWPTDSTLTVVASDSAVVTPLQTADYIVTATSQAGCSTTETALFTVNPLPQLELLSEITDTLCQWDSVYLEVTGANSYVWFPQDWVLWSVEGEAWISPDSTAEVGVIGYSNGCADTASVLVPVNQCIPDGVEEWQAAYSLRATVLENQTQIVLQNTGNQHIDAPVVVFDLRGVPVAYKLVGIAPGATNVLEVGQLARGLYIVTCGPQRQKLVLR